MWGIVKKALNSNFMTEALDVLINRRIDEVLGKVGLTTAQEETLNSTLLAASFLVESDTVRHRDDVIKQTTHKNTETTLYSFTPLKSGRIRLVQNITEGTGWTVTMYIRNEAGALVTSFSIRMGGNKSVDIKVLAGETYTITVKSSNTASNHSIKVNWVEYRYNLSNNDILY